MANRYPIGGRLSKFGQRRGLKPATSEARKTGNLPQPRRSTVKRYRDLRETRRREANLLEPLGWKRSAMVFVNSMSDLAHHAMPVEWFERIWRVMVEARRAS